jgi:hypothetical protein
LDASLIFFSALVILAGLVLLIVFREDVEDLIGIWVPFGGDLSWVLILLLVGLLALIGFFSWLLSR